MVADRRELANAASISRAVAAILATIATPKSDQAESKCAVAPVAAQNRSNWSQVTSNLPKNVPRLRVTS